MLENLFKFPIVKIDGDNEDRKVKNKHRFGDLPSDDNNEDDYDMVFGWAEYPFWDLIGIEDSWLPSRPSLDNAMSDPPIFDACIVRFINVGQLLVPMTRKEFKKSLIEFGKKYEVNKPKVKDVLNIKTLSIEEVRTLLSEDGK